jgi:hypothetical protein
VVTGGGGPPEGIVVIDTPAPAITDHRGAPIAARVLDRADVCWVVASGLRYADAGSWTLIRRAAARDLPILIVLNRLPEAPDVEGAIASDLRRRLVAEGVLAGGEATPVITVAEGPILEETGGLPPEWVARVRKELDALSDLSARREVIRRNVAAGLRRADRGLRRLREAMVDAALVHGELCTTLEDAYAMEADGFRTALAEGDLADLGSDPESLCTDLAALTSRRSSRAARAVAGAWEHRPAGAHILAAQPGLWGHGPKAFEQGRERFAEWNLGLGGLVLDTLGKRRMGRRRRARYEALIRVAAIDPTSRPGDRRAVRRRQRLGDAPLVARRWLAQVAAGLILGDADRFRTALGPSPRGEMLQRLRLPEVRLHG